jgi:hypothetical protein
MRLRIGEDQSQQQESENCAFQCCQRQTEFRVAQEKDDGSEQFDEKISRTDAGGAMAAVAAQHHPADYRHIVIEANEIATVWTSRPWAHNRKALRQAIDTHIQKAAKGQPKHKDTGGDQCVHLVSEANCAEAQLSDLA